MKNISANLKFFRTTWGLTQDQLAKLLSYEYRAILSYEIGERTPPINNLLHIALFYGISLDYLILYPDCPYPRNLKLLKLAKRLDNDIFSDIRNNIEGMIKTMWSKKINMEMSYRQDHLEIELLNSFNKNMKELRNLKKMTQPQLAGMINVSRGAVAQYETKSFPPIERLIELANIFDVSIHALVSGEKLSFSFDDKFFGKTILSVDQQLNIEEHKTLINLLEAAINNKT